MLRSQRKPRSGLVSGALEASECVVLEDVTRRLLYNTTVKESANLTGFWPSLSVMIRLGVMRWMIR